MSKRTQRIAGQRKTAAMAEHFYTVRAVPVLHQLAITNTYRQASINDFQKKLEEQQRLLKEAIALSNVKLRQDLAQEASLARIAADIFFKST